MKNTSKHEESFFQLSYVKYLLPILLIVVFVLAACGGSSGTSGNTSSAAATPTVGAGAASPTTGAATTPTVGGNSTSTTSSGACSLVTAAQAGSLLGGTVQTQPESVTVGTTQASGCAYKTTQGAAASISVVAAADTTTAKSTFSQLEQATKTTSGSQYQTVSGLGDGAFTNGKTLYVLKGKSLMIVTVLNNSTSPLSIEKQFAQAALPKVS